MKKLLTSAIKKIATGAPAILSSDDTLQVGWMGQFRVRPDCQDRVNGMLANGGLPD